MTFRDIAHALLLVVIGFLTLLGALHLTQDYRLFDDVADQCKQYGYIQNEHYRIICNLER